MKNRWNERDAKAAIAKYAAHGKDLALRTYSARLIGQEADLVLHGGGNTSVKTEAATLTGRKVNVLCVKGSGWDLETIEPAGHPAVRLEPLLELRALDKLSDEDMVNALRCNMLDSSGPNPSVEALLHAYLPHKFIDHTHADAILAFADQPDGVEKLLELGQGRMGVVPYIMPGFTLAQLAARVYEENPSVEGLFLYKHGIFTFGDTAEESYSRMIRWVSEAERRLRRKTGVVFHSIRVENRARAADVGLISSVLRGVCTLPQEDDRTRDPRRPMIVRHRSSRDILRFANSREAATLSQVGPATPDHVIRTKPKPVCLPPVDLGNPAKIRTAFEAALERFKSSYQGYVSAQMKKKKVSRIPLDPLPRIVIVPGAGLFSLAADAKAADIALDVYEHTISVIENATRIGRYQALNDGDLFDMEYWSLEQAKLGKTVEKPFSRKIVWISGAASGIGLATAAAFARLGAHVFMTDRDAKQLEESAASLRLRSQGAWNRCDVTSAVEVEESFARCAAAFGGVDIVVSNAGYAPSSPMKDCDEAVLRRSFEVNFFAHQNVAKAAARLFERQGLGGNLLFNASKSAFNPGPDFGPYALPKAGVVALMKQYAIELGKMGVRSNAVNADRVRTRLFGDGLLEKRAAARGVTVGEYLSGNLLHEEVYAEDVAQAFVHLALSRKTTGATLPVDGGNAAAFPR